MPRTITESAVGRFQLCYERFKRPDNGQWDWSLSVRADLLDQEGNVVRNVSVDDALSQLTPQQQNQLTNLATSIIGKVSQKFDVVDTLPQR